MNILLTDHEVRLLGCLIEKEMATPDYYPLTLNALVNACNQKSNRNPVVSFDEEIVLYGLNGLKESKMIRQSNVSRVPKYEHIFANDLKLVAREKAVICILMLRGPQTIGEIRGRTERLYSFQDLDEVQETLSTLEDTELVKKLPRQPGRKESRYTHLLSGEPGENIVEGVDDRRESETVILRKKNDRSGDLQEQLDLLRLDLQNLKLEFETFKSQFE
ncbi:MAG: YceH family protein [Desulfobacterales bacterium]|nr:YceH family protein [Desulfobacterales bacterium]